MDPEGSQKGIALTQDSNEGFVRYPLAKYDNAGGDDCIPGGGKVPRYDSRQSYYDVSCATCAAPKAID